MYNSTKDCFRLRRILKNPTVEKFSSSSMNIIAARRIRYYHAMVFYSPNKSECIMYALLPVNTEHAWECRAGKFNCLEIHLLWNSFTWKFSTWKCRIPSIFATVLHPKSLCFAWYYEAYAQFILWLWSTLVAYVTSQCLPAISFHFYISQSNFNSEPVGSPEAQLNKLKCLNQVCY